LTLVPAAFRRRIFEAVHNLAHPSITTDRGSQFTSGEWAAALRRQGIKHIYTTAFHPQSTWSSASTGGSRLKARLAGPAWPTHLPWVMLGLHAAPWEDSGISPAELTFGAALSLPASFITSSERSPESFLHELQSFLPCASPLSATLASSQPPPPVTAQDAATHVYVRAPPAAPALFPAYRGPYWVLWRGPKFYRLAIGGREDTISIDRLKPHLGGNPIAATPPARGRPPAKFVAPASSTVEPEPGGGGGTVTSLA
jgi:hypothetical protein